MKEVKVTKWSQWKKILLLPLMCLALDMSYNEMKKYEMDLK